MRNTLFSLAISAFLALGGTFPAGAQETFTLDELLDLGRERNPNLLSLRAHRDALHQDRRDAGRLENPELELSAGEGEPFEGGETKTLKELGLRQVIENPLLRHYRLKALEHEVASAGEDIRLGALEVDYEIRFHYFRILYLQERARLARLNAEALDEVRSLIETRARLGEVRDLEAIRLRVEHMRARNDLNAAELELSQFREHLNMFLSKALHPDYVLEGELTAEFDLPALARLQEEVLPGHPLLQQAARNREAAGQRLKGSRFGWLPSPVLSARSAQELDGDIVKLGVGFHIPLWNQSRAAVARDRETVRELRHREEDLRLELEAQVMIHHNHLRLHRQTLDLFREGLLEEAEASMQIAETSYREGEISLVEYLDARRTYQSIQIEFQQALYDWNRELAELERAAGGGIL